ncbi:LIM domain-containing protein [Yarrowia sp. C11]|nr:LIM domain-containing protein [Yarrowia sp. E02]KAG5369835.1 LIM domain-containing protein [Yarrowia sp. C11]
MSIPTHKTFSESQKVYIPPKWHRDKTDGKSPQEEEFSYRGFKVNAAEVAIEKEMILREYNRKKDGNAASHVTSHVAPDLDDIPVLHPGQVEGGGANMGHAMGHVTSMNGHMTGQTPHNGHVSSVSGHVPPSGHVPNMSSFENNARNFMPEESFPEYTLPRQTYPVEELGIPLADDGSEDERSGYDGYGGYPSSRGYEQSIGSGRQSGYDQGRYEQGRFDQGYDQRSDGRYDHGHPRDYEERGYERGYDRYDNVYEDQVTHHMPVDLGPVNNSYDQVDRGDRGGLPGHMRSVPDHVMERTMSRSPAPGHVYRTMSRSPIPDNMSRSPIPDRNMSRSPIPGHMSGHVSMPGSGHVSMSEHVMSRSPAPSHVSRSPVPEDGYYRHPQPVYDHRSVSPRPDSRDSVVIRRGYEEPRDHSDFRSVSPRPDFRPDRSTSPLPSYISKAPAPINTCLGLSSDDEYSPASPSFRPPLSPNLALSSDDEMMTIGEIKSAMAREEAARPTVAELRRESEGRFGTPRGTPSYGREDRSSTTSYGDNRSRTPSDERSTPTYGNRPGNLDNSRRSESLRTDSLRSDSTRSDSVRSDSVRSDSSRATRTWANTSRFSLADRRQDDTAGETRDRLAESRDRITESRDRHLASSTSRDRLTESRDYLSSSNSSRLNSSTSSISTFGYDSVGSNVSRGSFRYDTCGNRPGSRVSCYDEDFGNVTVETVREEDEVRDASHVQNHISRDFRDSQGRDVNSRDSPRDFQTSDVNSRAFQASPARASPGVPQIALPTADPHKSRENSPQPRDPNFTDRTHVKTLPNHVTPCAPPQPSYMTQSVSRTRPRCIVCDDHVAMNERIVQTESQCGSRDIYHLRCFRCCICDSSLEHMEHYIDPHSDMLFCHVDYHETFSPKCAQCSSCIEGDYVQAMGKTYHVDHFFCAQCGKPFQEDQQHHIIEGHAYCTPCHDVKTAEKCWRCSHVFGVNDPIIEVLDRLWCEACYSCEECGVGLQEEFTLTNEGVVLCEKCQVKKVKKYAWQ